MEVHCKGSCQPLQQKKIQMKEKASEILFNSDGSLYHLNICGDDLADDILLVGDPARVALISEMFSSIEKTIAHREFITVTGKFQGKRVTVISTGIGVDNIDIVLNEIQIAANYNRQKACYETERNLNLIRIGTSGALQPDIRPGEVVLSAYAVGIDGLFGFYKDEKRVLDNELTARFIQSTHWPGTLPPPYSAACSFSLANRFDFADHSGITLTAPGFYAPQGRRVDVPLAYPDLNQRMAAFGFRNYKVLNFEMETSAIYALGRSMGHKVLTMCVIGANRERGEMIADYQSAIRSLAGKVLETLSAL
jgi:uridine phosphorylase